MMNTMKKILFICTLALSTKFYSQDMLGLSNISISSGPSKYPELERAGSTIAFSTVNMAMNAGNIVNLNNKKKKSNAGFGVVTGFAQIANGVIFNEKEEDLKAIDVSVGAATVIFSSIRLLKKQKQAKEEKLSLAPAFLRAPFYGKITALALRLKF